MGNLFLDSASSLVSLLSSDIIAYESGDIMAVSSLMDMIDSIKKLGKSDPMICLICDCMTKLCNDEIQKENPNFTQALSEGIDTLKDISDSTSANSNWKTQRALDWIRTVIPSAHIPTGSREETVEAKHEKGLLASLTKAADRLQCEKQPEPVIDTEQFASFLSDCKERLAHAQELILALEQDLTNLDYIKELFRIFHTIKGECGFLKLVSLGQLTHTMENLLDQLRSSKIIADEQIINFLLNGLDLAKQMIQEISTGSVIIQNKVSLEDYVESLNSFIGNVKPLIGDVLVQQGLLTEKDQREIVREQANGGFKKKFGEVAIENNYISEEQIKKALKEQPTQIKTADADIKDNAVKIKKETADSIIKVKTSKINYLVDMIGELLIALGQIHNNVEGLAQIQKITRSLQFAGMQLRTESVRMLFGNIRRIIRDTSTKLNKPVKMEFLGEDLEIDRLLIEQLEEPLMHLVRNSLDHGIESAEIRTSLWKDPEGLIRVSAERRGNNIVIAVGDDGQGINREKVVQKAIDKKLISAEDAGKLTETAINNLLFLPGFSTKEKTDFISGRGVGMDIVKQVVTQARGHIETFSKKGKGTTFELLFPLSTAIIDGMTVRTGSNIFVIPIAVILESLKIKPESINRIREGMNVLNLRGQMIPIVSLADVFSIPDAESGQMITVVENTNREKYAIISDEILAKREIVIKSLGARFRDFKGISSGTVLPGGTIGLVLDIDQLIQLGIETGITGKSLPSTAELVDLTVQENTVSNRD